MGKIETFDEDDLPIDKFFWFNLSRTWVSNGFKNLTDIFEKLKTAVNWFFGLSTSGFFITIIWGEETLKGLEIGLLFIPLIFLFLAYGIAVMGQTISLKKAFEPNKHESIQNAYNNVMSKSRKFILCSALCLVVGLVSFPIILYSAVANKHIKEKRVSDSKKSPLDIYGNFLSADTTIHNNELKQNQSYIQEVVVSGRTRLNQKLIRLYIERGMNPNDRKTIIDQYIVPLEDSLKGSFYQTIKIPFEKGKQFKKGEKVFIAAEFNDNKRSNLNRITIEINDIR